jgi:hypothetical protein
LGFKGAFKFFGHPCRRIGLLHLTIAGQPDVQAGFTDEIDASRFKCAAKHGYRRRIGPHVGLNAYNAGVPNTALSGGMA